MEKNTYKRLLAHIYLKNGQAVRGFHDEGLFGDGNVAELTAYYEKQCIDGLIIFDLSEGKEEHETHLNLLSKLTKDLKIPLIAGGHIDSLDDIKLLLDCGCTNVFLNMAKMGNVSLLESAANTFGKEKIAICINDFSVITKDRAYFKKFSSFAILFGDDLHLYNAVRSMPLISIPLLDHIDFSRIAVLLKDSNVAGISGEVISNKHVDVYALKEAMVAQGIPMHYKEALLSWDQLKLNSDGMIPVIVQDYRNNQVLMMAYMNEEAYVKTVRTGTMTYWSRSRNELWVKGATSGHYQTVKELLIDCDNDTILARVEQTGAACHTGNRSCFYRSLLKNQLKEKDPASVFERLYYDAKTKEGEADHDKLVHDAADIMYHLTTLIAKHNVTWDEVANHIYERDNNNN